MSDRRVYLFTQSYINLFRFLLLCFYVYASDKRGAIQYNKHSPKMGKKVILSNQIHGDALGF